MVEKELKTKNRNEYMKKYLERPAVKERYNNYHKEWIWNRRHPREKKTEEVNQIVEDMKNYPANFSKEKFNISLDEILKNNPPEVKEKALKDLIYDILEGEKLLTPVRMMNLYYNPNWANAIEEFMKARGYFFQKEGEKYVKKE